MDTLDERFLVYTALATVCAALCALVSLAAGLGTFIQAALVIELLYWLAQRRGDSKGEQARTF